MNKGALFLIKKKEKLNDKGRNLLKNNFLSRPEKNSPTTAAKDNSAYVDQSTTIEPSGKTFLTEHNSTICEYIHSKI